MGFRVSETELLRHLWDLVEEIEKVPSPRDVDQHSIHSATTYQRRFGSWSAAAYRAGLPEPGSFSDLKPYQDESILRELYVEEDLTQEEVGERLGVAGTTISNWVRKLDISKDRGDTGPPAAELEELYWEKDMSLQEISDRYDTGAPTVYRWMDRRDIPRRPGPQTDHPYHDEDVLRELYFDEGMSQMDIADTFEVDPQTIRYWFDNHDIERPPIGVAGQEARRVPRATYYTTKSGYERVSAPVGYETHSVPVHRLVMVSEHGFDAVKGRVVHHMNGIPWDNRPENLQLMTDSDHKSLHAKMRNADDESDDTTVQSTLPI